MFFRDVLLNKRDNKSKCQLRGKWHIATRSRKHLQKLQGFLALRNPMIFEKHHQILKDFQKCLEVKESTPSGAALGAVVA